MSNSYAISVGSMHGEENVVHIVDFGINRFGRSKFVMDSKDSFQNIMFEKKLPKYKDQLDTIFLRHLLETINVNIAFNHLFSHLQNCPIHNTYVLDLKFLATLKISNVGNKVYFGSFFMFHIFDKLHLITLILVL